MATQFRFTSRVDGQEVIITARTPEEARQQMRIRDARIQGSPAAQMDTFSRQLAQRSADRKLGELETAALGDQSLASKAQTFMRANEMEPGTGPGSIGAMVPMFRNAPSQQMASIAAEITPTMRQPGSGATSDFDAKMFQEATLGLGKSPEVNRAIGLGYQARARRMTERAEAAQAWLADPKNLGTLVGFDRAWNQYSNEVPIFDPTSNPTNPRLNPNQLSFADYVASGMRVPRPRAQFARGERAAQQRAMGLTPERTVFDPTVRAPTQQQQPTGPRRFRYTADGKLIEQ